MYQKSIFRWLVIITSRSFLLSILLFSCTPSTSLFSEDLPENLQKNPEELPEVSPVLPSPEPSPSIPIPQKKESNPQMRLKIPKIQVDTIVESLGLTNTGEIGVPKNPTHAAWFTSAPRPGERGNAVISGHSGPWGKHTKTVFHDLSQMQKGDLVYITNPTGEVMTFEVVDRKSYDYNADASEVFTPDDGKAHLNLITCDGQWDAISKRYSQRLVIFTERK